ncbi:MAG: PEP-CTERM sorting domain-containing protein [Phycisphaerae bacterium]|nr:PEP-CTERM sorting domain-containing protein [Phycisphaerae bacterium]
MGTKRNAHVIGTLFAFVIVMACATAAPAGNTYWKLPPPAAGDWFDLANWTAGVPRFDDTAYIDNGGTAEIGSDISNSIRAYVGDTGQGTVVHTNGTVSVYTFRLGYSVGGVGLYELSGDATLSSYVSVGSQGNGVFVQTGGTASLAGLSIGYFDTGGGHYLLQSGHLNVSPSDMSIRTNGLFEQSGGTSSAAYTYIGYGESGGGTFRLTGGTHSVWGRVCVTSQYGKPNTALFELGGTGRLETPALWVGDSGLGRFVQTAGECVVQHELEVGTGAYNSTYELHGGALSAKAIQVGDDWYDATVGTFVQSGGSLAAGKVMINPSSRFEFTGGQMAFNGGLLNEGTFDFAATGGTLQLAAGSMLDMSKGTIANAANGRINTAANTLVMFPAGFDPATDLADYTSAGVTHIAGTTMVVPTDQRLVAFGSVEGHVQCHGSLRVAESSDSLSITDGLEVTADGSVDLGKGTLTVEDNTSRMNGTSLSLGNMLIAASGTGQFTHSAGQTQIEYNLDIGVIAGSEGALIIEGGDLSAEMSIVGKDGEGHVIHSGGSITFRNADGYAGQYGLVLGRYAGAKGIYELSGTGRLDIAGVTFVGGYYGDGHFIQTGGTHIAGKRLQVGSDASTGKYELSGGTLQSNWMSVGDYGGIGSGEFIHTGGSNLVTSKLRLNSNGVYYLSNTAEFSAVEVEVGHYGSGRFVQSGGCAMVSEELLLGDGPGGTGRYELSAGELSTGKTNIHEGTFQQTGGLHSVAFLTFGQGGCYEYAGGLLRVSNKLTLNGRLSAVPGATIHMTGSAFENESTDSAALSGLKNLRLIFEGGTADVDPFEVAGQDKGVNWEAFHNNFTLGTLQLGGADVGQVQLVDNYDNQPGWDGVEAQYVRNLTLSAGSQLDLGGLNLYCLNFANSGGTIIYNGGTLTQIPPIDSINATYLDSGFVPTGGEYGNGELTVSDEADIVVESAAGQTTYDNGSVSMDTSLFADNSADGMASGLFCGGEIIIQNAAAEDLLTGDLVELELREVIDGAGILAGQGLFEVTGGLLEEAFMLPLGDIVQITFQIDPADIDDFSGSFTGVSNITLTPVPEPATVSLLAVGAVALIRRRKK